MFTLKVEVIVIMNVVDEIKRTGLQSGPVVLFPRFQLYGFWFKVTGAFKKTGPRPFQRIAS